MLHGRLERGRKLLAERLGARIARQWKPAAIYTSGLQRCVVTAGKIAVATGTTASVLEGLMDLDYGAWQGRVQDEVRNEAPELFKLWHTAPQLVRFPNGESLQDLVARVAEAMRWVLWRLRYGFSVSEIADDLGVAPNTLSQRLSRVRRELKRKLDGKVGSGPGSEMDGTRNKSGTNLPRDLPNNGRGDARQLPESRPRRLPK